MLSHLISMPHLDPRREISLANSARMQRRDDGGGGVHAPLLAPTAAVLEVMPHCG
jgi:hypothetical protein